MRRLLVLTLAALFVFACGSSPEPTPTPVLTLPTAQVGYEAYVFTPAIDPADTVTPLTEQFWFGLKFDRPVTIYAPFDGVIVFPDQPYIIGGKNYIVFRLDSNVGSKQIEFYMGESRVATRLLVSDGNSVRAGDPIAKIVSLDPTPFSIVAGASCNPEEKGCDPLYEPFQMVGFWRNVDGTYLKLSDDTIQLLISAKAGRVDPP